MWDVRTCLEIFNKLFLFCFQLIFVWILIKYCRNIFCELTFKFFDDSSWNNFPGLLWRKRKSFQWARGLALRVWFLTNFSSPFFNICFATFFFKEIIEKKIVYLLLKRVVVAPGIFRDAKRDSSRRRVRPDWDSCRFVSFSRRWLRGEHTRITRVLDDDEDDDDDDDDDDGDDHAVLLLRNRSLWRMTAHGLLRVLSYHSRNKIFPFPSYHRTSFLFFQQLTALCLPLSFSCFWPNMWSTFICWRDVECWRGPDCKLTSFASANFFEIFWQILLT